MKTADLGFTALKVTGGLLPPDFLGRIAALDAGDQDNAAYGLTKSFNIRDEIGRFWRVATDLWTDFRSAREANPAPARVAVDRWLVPFLTQVLGFSVDRAAPVTLSDRTFPLTHRGSHGTVSMVLCPPAFDLDKADTAFGEEGRRRTPFGLVQEYLNADDDTLWGLVANGLVLRILRDNPSLTRPAYIEIDLERTFEDGLYPDFAAFWLLAHASRFVPREAGLPSSCILERWRASAQETGERARDKLRDGVTTALITFGQGFVGHPANDRLRADLAAGRLGAMDLHQELLRLVYRCLFLLTIEDRGLFHPPGAGEDAKRLYRDGYSLGNMRERALRPRAFDAFTDLWQGLRITSRAMVTGAEAIAAPALGGLFDPTQCRNLDQAELTNADLLTAIKALAFFPSGKMLARINYRDMNTEEFGSVYESLLELHPLLETAPWRFGYVGINGHAAKGSERKLSGSYYTPAPLVYELIKSALEPVIRRTATDNPYDQRAALLKLAILDPACGSGHFLLAAARRLAMEIARIDAAPDAPSEAQRQHALREVVRHCIYGVDKNPLAVELCKTALWIETVEPGRPLGFLDHRIRCGDSLIGVFDLKVLENGIPDGAFKRKTGDDQTVAREVKKRNAAERKGQRALALTGGATVTTMVTHVATKAEAIEALPEDEIASVTEKAKRYRRCQLDDPDLMRLRQAADIWCAAFFAMLVPPKPGQPERIPTTEAVRAALDGGAAQAVEPKVMALAQAGRFFHWPLEFAEVFQRGGFDVVLGNPPWEQVLLNEEEWFAQRLPEIATAPNSAARHAALKSLRPEYAILCIEFDNAVRNVECQALFLRKSGGFPLTGIGRINTYSLFQEKTEQIVAPHGIVGLIIPTGALTDFSQTGVTSILVRDARLSVALDFENGACESHGRWFPHVHPQTHFVILAYGGRNRKFSRVHFAASCVSIADAHARKINFPVDFISIVSPNTGTFLLLQSDIELTIINTMLQNGIFFGADVGPSIGVAFSQPFNASSDSDRFKMPEQLGLQNVGPLSVLCADGSEWWPLLEAKCGSQYNHRYGSFQGADRATRERKNAGAPIVSIDYLRSPEVVSVPRYWVSREDAVAAGCKGPSAWQLLFRFSAYPDNERTMIAWIAPNFPSTHITPRIVIPCAEETSNCKTRASIYAFILGALNSLCFDLFVRRRMSRQGIDFFILKQTIIPQSYHAQINGRQDEFILARVLELTYTARDLQPFAYDLGYEGPPFAWNLERRALLLAELDAYYAYLYGLTRDELRYILDPQDIVGDKRRPETFRVLKNRDVKEFREYRTRQLVLEAFDRFHSDGTFDLARIEDRSYFPAIKSQLVETRVRLAETQQELAEARKLLARADADLRPTLFVEGETDVTILTAAWEVLLPGAAMPFKVLAAGGTMQLRSLAAPGKALRPILGERLVMALADNDGEGRELWRDGTLHKGGTWKQQTNGVWWCLLPPSDAFRAAMAELKIDPAFWPFTIENAFSPALRARAKAEGAYALAKTPQSDLMTDGGVRKRVLEALFDLPADDPLSFWLRAPAAEAKTPFAAWITAPARRTPETFAVFAPVLTGLEALIARRAAPTPPAQAQLL